jgi:hypothetical protein
VGFNISGQTYKNITSATTTVVKAGPGQLHFIVVNTPGTTNTVTIYDNTAASGTKIGTITAAAQGSVRYECDFTTGLTVVTGATSDITVVYT